LSVQLLLQGHGYIGMARTLMSMVAPYVWWPEFISFGQYHIIDRLTLY
jgi:hypothetical protein